MKEIKLTKDKFALVDDEDFEYLNQFRWSVSKGSKKVLYANRGVWDKVRRKVKNWKMHRVILCLTDPKVLVDHIDHNGLNNQRSNLREVTVAQNNKNRRSCKNSTSKYTGVSIAERKGSSGTIHKYWVATIGSNNKTIYLGTFKNEKEAAIAYNKGAIMYHGEFANLNDTTK
jgi:hypothetical protein